MTHHHEDLIARWVRAESTGDFAALKEVWHDDVREIFPGRGPFSAEYRGHQALVDFYSRAGAAAEAIEMMELSPLAYGETHVLLRNRENVTIKGTTFTLDRHIVAQIRDGKIYEVRIHEFDQYATDEFFEEVSGA